MDQSTAVIPPAMAVEEARACVDAIRRHMESARTLLLDLYERRGWEALGYESWRECAVAEFGESQSRVYQLLQAAEIQRRISTIVETTNIPESQLRPLAKLTPIEQKDAWEEAVASAPDGKLTARHVAEVVERRLSHPAPVEQPPPPEADHAPVATQPAAEDMPSAANSLATLFSSASPEWYTPKAVVERIVRVLGEIDVDPCSNSGEPNVPARTHYTEEDDGLAWDWEGRVYMNPPYGRGIGRWVGHLVEQYQQGIVTEAIALVPARVDTDWFQSFGDVYACFVDGRLKFSGHENAAPFPSAIIYLGNNQQAFVTEFRQIGTVWKPIAMKEAEK